MRRARQMWTQIAGEQAQLQAIDQNPPGWTAGKKARAQRSSRLRERKGQNLGVARPGWRRYPGCATKSLSPPLNVGHQMTPDSLALSTQMPHDSTGLISRAK